MSVTRWEKVRFWVSVIVCAGVVAGSAVWARALREKETPVLSQAAQAEETFPALVRPVPGETLRGFERQGWNATLRCYDAHEALDLAANEGDAVLAALSGTVVAVRRDRLLGGVVEVESEGGILCRYAALKWPAAVSESETVEAGQRLGDVGGAPCEAAQGAHVHFALIVNGETVEPRFHAEKER